LRDADVIVEVIRTLRPVRGGDAAFVQVLTRAQQERRKVRHEFRSAGTIAAARRDIVDAGARLEGWATREIDGDAIIAGLRRSLKRARASAPGRSLDDERWHEWRKRTKDMWYHLRLVKSVWPTILDGAIGQFKVLADDLGDDHDLAIISGRLHELSPNRGAVRELGRLRHAIARRRDELHAKAIANGRCLLAATPRAFAERFEASWRSWRS
jgi:CHAD domain-containing protein